MWSTYPELRLARPDVWRAPSWSWASVDNAITFERLPPKDAIILAEIVQCSVTPRSPISSFGEVSEATLEITGPVLEFDREILGKSLKKEYMVPAPEGRGETWRRFLINMARDMKDKNGNDSNYWEPPEGVVLLAMFAQPIKSLDDSAGDEDSAVVSGLVLAKKEGDEYVRIVCFTTLKVNCLSNLEGYKKTVKII